MKKLIFIAILFFTTSCLNTEKQNKKISEKEAYELLNNFLIKEISNNGKIILFNNRHLKPPSMEVTYDSVMPIPMIYPPYPTFTKSFWNQEKINGVKFVEWETYNSYFQKNDSINMREKWTENFGYNLVYNVSFPIYNVKTKLAAIRVYPYASNLNCGTDLDRVYLYKKSKNGWTALNN